MTAPFSVRGRRVLVTGASGHLGRAMAVALAAAGARPVLAARNEHALRDLARDIEAAGGACEQLPLDAGDPAACRAAIDRLARHDDTLDGIVTAAYSGRAATLESATDADFEAAARLNLAGPFALVQQALPLLRKAAARNEGGASIVNIASMYGHVSPDPRIYGDSGKNNPPFYGPTKAALLQFTRYLAAHLGPDRIRANSISPGPFPPPSIRDTSPEFHAELCRKTPLGRIGHASELVGPLLFLLSDASSFVTGADLAVDGGWTAW